MGLLIYHTETFLSRYKFDFGYRTPCEVRMSESSSTPGRPSQLLATAPASKRRAMTGTRLEKKRQTDRESQRTVRERTKKYISHLESLVETLQKSQQDERLQRMAEQCQELRHENEQLKSIFTGIRKMIRGIEVPKMDGNGPKLLPPDTSSVAHQHRHGAPTSGHCLANYPSQAADLCQNSLPCISEQRLAQDHVASQREPPILSQPSPAMIRGPPLSQTFQRSPEVLPISQATDTSEGLLGYEKDDAQLFAVIGNALRKAQETQSLALTYMDPEQDADIAIRAVIDGWQTVELCHTLDSAWHLLRYIDQNIFSYCGSVERLAILRLLRLKLQVNGFWFLFS
jgi:hypothetical protein